MPNGGLYLDKGLYEEVERFIFKGDMGDIDEFLIEKLAEVIVSGFHALAAFGA